MYDPYNQFEEVALENGLTVYHQYWNRPWIGVQVIVHAGAREDKIEIPGLAHFLEHCVSNNIPGYTYAKVRAFVDESGGMAMFGETSYLATKYGFSLPTEPGSLTKMLNIFGSMLLEANVTKGIEKERLIIKQEFGRAYPIAQSLEWLQEKNSNLFKGHRLESYNRPLGTLEGFMNAKKKDLQAFYDQYYVPSNISIVVVGGINKPSFISALSRTSFTSEKPGERNPVARPTAELLPNPVMKSKVVEMSKLTSLKLNQLNYEASWTLPGNINFQALQAANQIVDHFLGQVIREEARGSYHFSSRFEMFQDVYLFEIQGAVDPKLADSINEMVHRCL